MRNKIYDEELDLWVREGCVSDPLAGREVKAYKPVFGQDENWSGRVLDIGGHIGSFSRMYAKMFPNAWFQCYEPHPKNYEMCIQNTHIFNDRVKVFHGAVTDANHPVILWGNKGFQGKPVQGTGMHSLIAVKGRERIEVDGYAFSDILKQFKPDIIKMDCEGGEFFVLEELQNLPEYVQGIAIEIHNHPKDTEIGMNLMHSLLEQFPNQLRGKKFKDSSWPKVIIARRDL